MRAHFGVRARVFKFDVLERQLTFFKPNSETGRADSASNIEYRLQRLMDSALFKWLAIRWRLLCVYVVYRRVRFGDVFMCQERDE